METENRYIDIHTHKSWGKWVVRNLLPWEAGLIEQGFLYSIGLHPWYQDSQKNNQWLDEVQKHAGRKEIVAIGEAGLDRLSDTPLQEQVPVFLKQADIAGQVGKPLIIHCVKAWHELVGMMNETKPAIAWIVHGFRSKPEIGKMLLDSGFCLSFGSSILNPVSNAVKVLAEIPEDRFFLETDDGDSNISEIYNAAAKIRGCSVDALVLLMENNFNKLRKRPHE